MKYFTNVQNLEQLKSRYRELCKTLHPDKGGSTEAMQAVNAEYEKLARVLLSDPAYTTQADSEAPHAASDIELEERLRVALEQIAHLDGLDIEIIGRWIWVGGDTRTHKDVLKAAGYEWAFKKKLWFFKGVSSRSRGNIPMDEIRQKYGSERVKSSARAGLN